MANKLLQRSVRQAYLITHSQADLETFPTRVSFADAILEAFASSSSVEILHWVAFLVKKGGSKEIKWTVKTIPSLLKPKVLTSTRLRHNKRSAVGHIQSSLQAILWPYGPQSNNSTGCVPMSLCCRNHGDMVHIGQILKETVEGTIQT